MTFVAYASALLGWGLLCVVSPTVRQRTLNWLIAFDQLIFSTVTLGRSHPDETMSAAAWRTERKNRLLGIAFRPLIDLIFLPLEREHCRKAYESERRGSQLPKEYQL